jgi:hypothetical protein
MHRARQAAGPLVERPDEENMGRAEIRVKGLATGELRINLSRLRDINRKRGKKTHGSAAREALE